MVRESLSDKAEESIRAKPDKLSPSSGTNPVILFILSLNFSHEFSVDAFKIYIPYIFYKKLFVKQVLVVLCDQLL